MAQQRPQCSGRRQPHSFFPSPAWGREKGARRARQVADRSRAGPGRAGRSRLQPPSRCHLRYLPCAQPQNGHLGPGVQLHVGRHGPHTRQKHHRSGCRARAFNSSQARPAPARRGAGLREVGGLARRRCAPERSCEAGLRVLRSTRPRCGDEGWRRPGLRAPASWPASRKAPRDVVRPVKDRALTGAVLNSWAKGVQRAVLGRAWLVTLLQHCGPLVFTPQSFPG